MSNLLELASSIVSAHASTSEMSTEELLLEIQKVYAKLQQLESGAESVAGETKPSITFKEAFKANEVVCMICGKGGMKTLTRHLNTSHSMKPGEYRKQFGIPRTQSLTAKKFSESRRQLAQQRDLASNLAKAREVRAANLKSKKSGKTNKK